jgi:hypothetical protein
MSQLPRALLGLCLGVAVLGASCNRDEFRNRAQEAENARRAQAMVDAYFRAASEGSSDLGWSLLHPDSRRAAFGDDYARYEALVRAADWSRFRWSVLDVIADDPTLYLVEVRIPGGPAVMPRFLVDQDAWRPALIAIPSADAELVTIPVRMEWPFGPVGIYAAFG